FVGWLRRSREAPAARGSGDGELAWRQLLLTGAPAVVEVPGGRLTTPRLCVVPGPTGEPALVSAHGGASSLEQIGLPEGSRQEDPATASTRRRMVLWRPAGDVGAVHRAFGFPK